ncbi:ATP-dependent helicase [Candidatus Saccharibacteria bacterium]|nr:ATP-dependent helicase [Candidatus Saccharibacteria bacterium]
MPTLNEAQKTAVEYMDGPLLVLAGPGTGKTQLLSSKVEYILKEADASPDMILCLTFTESGASNMRERLYSIIGPDAGKVHIHTYHSFGSDILAQYKNYTNEYDRDLDAAIDSVTQSIIIKSIQDKLDPFDILRKTDISTILSIISSAKSASLTGKDLEIIAKKNIADMEQMNSRLDAILSTLKKGERLKFDDGVMRIYRPILEVFEEYASEKPILGNIYSCANTYRDALQLIIDNGMAQEKPSIKPLSDWKRNNFELDSDNHWRLKNYLANLRLLSLSHIMQEYEKYLETSSLYDFADMIQQAIKILNEDEGFKKTLQEKYQYILLDEFQDTSTAQAELIYLLTDYDQPQIMAVGDDDQAIYAFQGANVSNMKDFKKRYNAASISLVQNYRSCGEIIDLSKKVREQIMDSYSKTEGEVKDLKAAKSGTAEITRHEFLEDSAEYHWIAEQIHRLIKSGVKQSEIAVITPKHRFVTPLIPYLKEYEDIKIAYEKRDNLFEDQKIHELFTLAQFVYGLAQGENVSHMLLEILSFEFLEVPPLSAIKAVNRDRTKNNNPLDYLTSLKDEKLTSVAEFLAELAGRVENTPLELFIDYLTGTAMLPSGNKSAFLDYYTNGGTEYSNFELYDNLHVFREAIRKHCNTETPKLADLVRFINDYKIAEEPLNSTSPYRESADAVQIMTAHKSKGLEFEYVFLISVNDKAWGNAKGNNDRTSLPVNLTQIRHTGKTDDECLRLFFVAITRAKKNLIMTNSVQNYSDKKPGHLQYLAEAKTSDDKLLSPYLPKTTEEVVIHYQGLSTDEEKSDLTTSWISAYQKPDGDIREILLARLENYRLTATDLTSFIDISYAGPQKFYEERILRAPSESYSESLTFGNIIHSTFEQVVNQKLTDDEALNFFHEQVKIANIPEDELENFIKKGEKSLRKSLGTFGNILRSESVKAEVDLSHEHPTLDKTPLKGRIDLIRIDEEEKAIDIYDYKTSGFKKENWSSHPTLYKYMLQLGFYKLLLNLSPTYNKYKIRSAQILFVVPDSDDGEVHLKSYEYNEADEELLKKLAVAVYNQIKSLSFLDNPNLFIKPDKDRGLKDVKNFVELILDTSEE